VTDPRKKTELESLFRSGKIGRRSFMQGVSALGLSAAFANSVISDVQAATPKKGGTARLGLGHGGTTDSLDPATFEDGYMLTLGYAVRNHLTEIDENGKLSGDLAESWEVSDDASEWVFNLRQGVEFHNGKTFDAEDVVASINHHRGEESKSAAKPIVNPIKEIKADGKNKVVVKLESGNADFPLLMSDYHLAIMPAKDGKADWQSGIGTGGYVLENLEPGVRSSAKRFANYWKEGKAHFDAVEILSIKDLNAKQSALATGEIDMMDRPDLKTAGLLKRNPQMELEQTTGTLHYTFPMRTDTKPFDDNNVRMALKHGVDRELLVKTILKGYGTVGNDHPIAPSNPYFDKNLEQRTFDPDKSKYYLKQAGLSSLSVDLSAADSAFSGAVDAAVLYKENAAKAGIDINIVREPNDGYWSNVWMKKAWCACYWGGRPTEDWMFSTAYSAGAEWNDTFWKHDRFNKLLLEGRSELDTKKRAEIYSEMQRIVRDEGGVVVPMFAALVWVRDKKVAHGPNIASNYEMDGGKSLERWWFA